jgi:hypothetical protein
LAMMVLASCSAALTVCAFPLMPFGLESLY